MKMCHVCYYNNDATFRLLMSGDINPNPGPVSASTAGKINCLVMNARSLKSYHKDSTTNWQSVCNLDRFQDLVYAENSSVICVNETWLNQNISNSEILQSGFTIFRRDRSDRGCGGVLIAIKIEPPSKPSKNLNLNQKPSCNSLRSFLPKLLRLQYWSNNFILFLLWATKWRPKLHWIDVFDNFLHEVCDQLERGVFNTSKIDCTRW